MDALPDSSLVKALTPHHPFFIHRSLEEQMRLLLPALCQILMQYQ